MHPATSIPSRGNKLTLAMRRIPCSGILVYPFLNIINAMRSVAPAHFAHEMPFDRVLMQIFRIPTKSCNQLCALVILTCCSNVVQKCCRDACKIATQRALSSHVVKQATDNWSRWRYLLCVLFPTAPVLSTIQVKTQQSALWHRTPVSCELIVRPTVKTPALNKPHCIRIGNRHRPIYSFPPRGYISCIC